MVRLSLVARRLASLWLALACLVLAALLLIWSLASGERIGWTIAVPFGGMCVNLLAALVATPALRRQAGLLVFHLGLAILALTVAVGRLTSLDGRIEVTEGMPLDPAAAVIEAGPLHRFALPFGAFIQGAFDIDYRPGMVRTDTRSHILLPDGRGALVGDDTAAVVAGYRLYTTSNKGFAPLLAFRAADGAWSGEALHLPPYPMQDYKQGTEWLPPKRATPITVWLHLPKPVYDEAASWQFRKPDDAVLIVDDGNTRRELRPGDETDIAGGRLRYEELRTWMGYTIHYDPSRPWLLAAGLVALAGLTLHGVVKAAAIAELTERPRTRRRTSA